MRPGNRNAQRTAHIFAEQFLPGDRADATLAGGQNLWVVWIEDNRRRDVDQEVNAVQMIGAVSLHHRDTGILHHARNLAVA